MILGLGQIAALLGACLCIIGNNVAAADSPAEEQIRLDDIVAVIDAHRSATPEEQALLVEGRERMLSAPAPLGDVRGHWRVDVIRVDAGSARRGAAFDASITDANGVLAFARTGDGATRHALYPVHGEPEMLAMIGAGMQALMARDPSSGVPESLSEPSPFEHLAGGRLRRLHDGSLLLVLLSSQARLAIYHLLPRPAQPDA